MMGTAARAEGLVRRYGSGPAAVTALDGVRIEIETGTLTAVMGPSGSGNPPCCTALGLGLGAALAAAFTRSQQLTVSIPAGQVIIYAVAAAFAGLLAAIGPARRAARMNMLAAMTPE